MNNCCGIGDSTLNEEFDIVRINALQYVKEEKKSVAIYKDGREFKFCDPEYAIEQGYDIAEVVSKY